MSSSAIIIAVSFGEVLRSSAERGLVEAEWVFAEKRRSSAVACRFRLRNDGPEGLPLFSAMQ